MGVCHSTTWAKVVSFSFSIDTRWETVLTDDHHQIPRSTSVIIRRIAPNPKLKNGGTAARYIAGTSASVGGRDDLVDRRVEASSREELMNKRGLGGLGRGGGMMGKGNMTARFDKKEEEDVGVFFRSCLVRIQMRLSRYLIVVFSPGFCCTGPTCDRGRS